MPGNPLTDPNWAPELADTVERVVGSVRDNATIKAVTIVHAMVYGILISVAGIVAVVLLIILGTKFLQHVLTIGDLIEADSAVGISYLIMGAVLVIGGFVSMSRRRLREQR